MRYATRFLSPLVLTVLLLSPGLRPSQAEEEDARDLVARVLDALPKETFNAKMTVSSESFQPRELNMTRKFVDGAHGSYLEVTSPDELEGIRFLFLERANEPNDQYIKVKASRSAIHVSEEVRRQPFLSSTFYVSDLVMPNLDDYTYAYLGKDVLDGRTTTLVEMTPKDVKADLYSKTIAALDPSDLLILRREYFDKKGDKVKVWTVDKVEKIEGIWTLSGQKMENVQEGSESRLDVSDIKYNVEVSDAIFTPKYLLR
jgi:outer membrane lipoprotein-sorting protein